ncbi:hypothetical protein Adt_14551 [Abeliophyllum distichum]|uniref:Uncharacterized protein n=1 Tax=Abeliophyllum distichum TaxID=126358 RepID=A0ABD1TZY4_9LAMI
MEVMVQAILHSSHLTGSSHPMSLRPRISDGVSLEALTLRRFGRPTGRGHFPSRETQQSQVASSGASLDESAIAKEVLGERRGHVRGVGRVIKGNSFPRFDLCIEGPRRNIPSIL